MVLTKIIIIIIIIMMMMMMMMMMVISAIVFVTFTRKRTCKAADERLKSLKVYSQSNTFEVI